MKCTLFLLPLFLSGCFSLFGGGDDDHVTGNLISTIAQTSIQQSPDPEITLVGQSVAGFSAKFTESDFGSPKVGVKLSGLKNDENYIFEVSQNGLLDAVITFPFNRSNASTIDLPAVPVGTIEAIKQAAVGVGISQSASKGMILGQLSSSGTGCSPVLTVTITSSAGSTAGVSVPHYFDQNGNLVTNGFSDNECNYAIFNVPQGNYTLRFDGQFSAKISEIALTTFNDKVSFGLNVP